MAKSRFICKLLGLSLAMLTASSSVFALSAEEILSEVRREYGAAIRKIDQETRGITFSDYINLSSIRASHGFKSFVRARCETPELVDSALFLNLLERISGFDSETRNRRQFEALKQSLFERMVSLREREEFRNDKFIVSDFDEYFSSSIKTIFEQFRPQSSSRSKTQREVRY